MSEFGTLDLEEMQGEDTRLSQGQNNFLDQFVPMPEVKPGATGTVSVRILPPVKGAKLYQYNRTHKLNDRSIHCPRPLINGKWDRSVVCPICDYYSSLWKQIDKLAKAGHVDESEKLKDEARLLKPVERYYYNAIVRSMTLDGKEIKNAGPRILSVGVNLHKMIIRAIVGEDGDPDSKLGNITDLKAGWDFIIRKEVTTGDGYPKYDRSGFSRNTSPAGTPEEIQRWQESLHDLTKLRNPKELDYLEKELAIHRGLIPDESEGFDTDAFDAKWGKKNQDEVNDLMEYAGTSVSVPADVPSDPVVDSASAETPTVADSAPVADTPAAPAGEDLAIEDEDFLKELEAMES